MRPVLVATLLLAACGGDAPPVPDGAPNVVVFLSDTHRWGSMSFTQTPAVRTPNMERLAKEGVSVDRHYANVPLCSPYRALLMTGRWPFQQGVIANDINLRERPDLPPDRRYRGTLAWMFQDAGYRTALFGKWHLGNTHDRDLPYVPKWFFGGRSAQAFGFDRSVIWNNTNNHRSNTFQINGGRPRSWSGESNSEATARQALEWIEEQARSPRPFFVLISVNPPHERFDDAPDSKKALYPDPETLPFHPLDRLRDFELHQGYHAHISAVDEHLGMVDAELGRLGLRETTILVYTSDHGALGGVVGDEFGDKRTPHDLSARVPLLIRWPGEIGSDARIDFPTSAIDLPPTLLGLAGITARLSAADTDAARSSLQYAESLPGFDFAPFLLGRPEGLSEPTSVFLAHPSAMDSPERPTRWRAVVTDEYVYSVRADGEHYMWSRDDELQQTNLAGDSTLAPVRRRLWREVDSWMDRAERPFYRRWLDAAGDPSIAGWNFEHGAAYEPDRALAESFLFDLSPSKPPDE